MRKPHSEMVCCCQLNGSSLSCRRVLFLMGVTIHDKDFVEKINRQYFRFSVWCQVINVTNPKVVSGIETTLLITNLSHFWYTYYEILKCKLSILNQSSFIWSYWSNFVQLIRNECMIRLIRISRRKTIYEVHKWPYILNRNSPKLGLTTL